MTALHLSTFCTLTPFPSGGYALPPKKRAKWLDAAAGFKAFGLSDTLAGRRGMVERLDKRAVSEEIKSCGVPPQSGEVDARASHLRRGWYWGTQVFGEAMRKLGQKLLKKSVPASRAYRKHALVRDHGERQAEVWLAQGLKGGGLKAAELAQVKGSDARKVLLADLLWRRTVVSQEWLAEKLEMKSAANVSQQLRRLDRKAAIKKVPQELKHFLEEADAAKSSTMYVCQLFAP